MANVLGLNISAAFNSAVTIYILIPFLIIPQMVLTGAMFSFDKINRNIGGGREKVPIIAEVMPSRWAFEALIVNQFVNNRYERQFYDLRKLESAFNYKNVYYLPELKGYVENFRSRYMAGENEPISRANIELLYNEITKENNSPFARNHDIIFPGTHRINPADFNMNLAGEMLVYLNNLHDYYRLAFNRINEGIDNKVSNLVSTGEKREDYQKFYDAHFNTYLSRFAKNSMAPLPLVRLGNHLVQKIDPVYLDPQDRSITSFRAHFMAPTKNLFGTLVPTFYFNILIIWIFTIMAYVALYYNALSRMLAKLENVGENLSKLKLLSGLKKKKSEDVDTAES
jgi:ABC transport system ATP-binding/permease protein